MTVDIDNTIDPTDNPSHSDAVELQKIDHQGRNVDTLNEPRAERGTCLEYQRVIVIYWTKH